jgi:hypothetical protein
MYRKAQRGPAAHAFTYATAIAPNTGQRKSACSCGGGCPRCKNKLPIQTKLAVSQPGDVYEQKADRVAEQVMRMSAGQRCSDCASEEKRKPLQRKAEKSFETLTPAVSDSFVGNIGPGRPLDSSTREFFEPRFGHDFSNVRIHTGAKAAESARAVNALAYTAGRDVVFGAAQYAPETTKGKSLLAHELAHTVQQSRTDGATATHDREGSGSIHNKPRGLLQRQTIDTATCGEAFAGDFRSAHSDAIDRVEYALRQLDNPRSISRLLQTHFKAGQGDDAKVGTIRAKLGEILGALKGGTNTYHCEADATCKTEIGRDTNNNPLYRAAYATATDITFCHYTFDYAGASQTILLIHETSHTNPANLPDGPYRTQAGYPGATPTNNAEAYSEFVNDVWDANRLIISAPLGVLVSGDDARFAFGVTAQYVAGRRLFWGLDLTLGASFYLERETGSVLFAGQLGFQRELSVPRITIGAWGTGGFGGLETTTGSHGEAGFFGGGAGIRWNVFDDLDVGVSFDYLRAKLEDESDPNRYLINGSLSWKFF